MFPAVLAALRSSQVSHCVGSTNVDDRSFRLNDEATRNIMGPAFPRVQTAVLEADLASARRVSLVEWRRGPWRQRLGERLASVMRRQR